MAAITLAEAKQACGISHTARDDFLQGIVDGTEDWLEEHLGRIFNVATRIDYLTGGGRALRPYTRPVNSVSEVYDVDGAVTWDPDDYVLKHDSIRTYDGSRWESEPPSRWRVTYSGGEAAMPNTVKMAALMIIARTWENPQGLSSQSAAGMVISYATLMGSDIAKFLQMYRRGTGPI